MKRIIIVFLVAIMPSFVFADTGSLSLEFAKIDYETSIAKVKLFCEPPVAKGDQDACILARRQAMKAADKLTAELWKAKRTDL